MENTHDRITVEYIRKDDKKHSVTFTPAKDAPMDVLGQVYVKKVSGLANDEKLLITVERVKK